VIVKLYKGRSEQQKAKIAEAVTRAIVSAADSTDDAISVGIEDIEPADWDAKVWQPDIAGKAGTLYKKPGYGNL